MGYLRQVWQRLDELSKDGFFLETGQQENPADASATATAAATVTEFRYDLNRIFTTDNDTYLYAPIPKDHIGFVSCRVTRHTGFSPIYHLYFERQNENDLVSCL